MPLLNLSGIIKSIFNEGEITLCSIVVDGNLHIVTDITFVEIIEIKNPKNDESVQYQQAAGLI